MDTKEIEDKLDQILQNQALIVRMLAQIYNKSQFTEDYAANLFAQMTEIVLGNNIIRK